MFLLSVLAAAAAPVRTLDIPVDRGSATIPIAAQQRYLGRAVAEAIEQLDLRAVAGRRVALDIAGVLQMSDDDLGEFIAEEIKSHVALAGGRVDEEAENRLIVRIAQAGIDRVLESRKVSVPRKKGWPIAMMVTGSSVATLTALYASNDSSWNPIMIPLGVTGGLTAATGVGLLFLPPKRLTVECEVFRARVTIDTTFVPDEGKSKKAHGEADILVDDSDAPCEDEAQALRASR